MSFATEKEQDVYRAMIAEVVNGDPERKKSLDMVTSYAINGLKEILPNATDEELAKVLMYFAIVMSRIQALPFNVASLFVQHAFEGYVASVAVLAGAYEPDPANLPDLTKKPETQTGFTGQFSDAEWEDHLKKMYLL
jgi:hypothetical protein